MMRLELVVARAGAQRVAQVGLGHREQAGAQLALGGDPDPVAVAAEGLAHRGDKADRALSVGELPAPRRGRPICSRSTLADGVAPDHMERLS
jgi:hypothetical protein